MSRLIPLLAPLLGLAVALGIALIEVGRDEGAPEVVARETPVPPATVTPTADPFAANNPFASNGRFWARGFQAPSTSNGPPSVAIADDGSIVVGMTISYFEAPPGEYEFDVGGGAARGGGSWDGVLAKYDPSGALQWSRPLTGPGDELIADVAVTADGAILVSGTYGDGADLGRGAEQGTDDRDTFLARYRSDGTLEWLHTYAGEGRDAGGQLGFFSDGDIAWSGRFFGSGGLAAFMTDPEVAHPGFIARLSPDGEPEWVAPVEGRGVFTVDRSSDVVIFGYNNALVTNSPASLEFGVGSLSPEGELIWRYPFVGRGHASVSDIEVLSDGSSFIVGRFFESTDFGAGLIEPRGCCDGYTNENMVSDAFALRLSADGEHVWSKSWGGNLLDDASSATLEPEGTVLVGGTFWSTLDVHGLDVTLPGVAESGVWNPEPESRAYIARFTPDGEAAEVMYVDDVGRVERIGPIIVDSAATDDGEILVGGRYFFSVTFPFGGRIANSEWLDYFLARIEAP